MTTTENCRVLVTTAGIQNSMALNTREDTVIPQTPGNSDLMCPPRIYIRFILLFISLADWIVPFRLKRPNELENYPG
jgi:hypothetical protein